MHGTEPSPGSPGISATGASTITNISAYGDRLPMTLIASGLGAAEVIDIQIETTEGVYVNVFQDGTQVQLTDVNNVVTVYGPGTYSVVKGVTAGAVGVFSTSEMNK